MLLIRWYWSKVCLFWVDVILEIMPSSLLILGRYMEDGIGHLLPGTGNKSKCDGWYNRILLDAQVRQSLSVKI